MEIVVTSRKLKKGGQWHRSLKEFVCEMPHSWCWRHTMSCWLGYALLILLHGDGTWSLHWEMVQRETTLAFSAYATVIKSINLLWDSNVCLTPVGLLSMFVCSGTSITGFNEKRVICIVDVFVFTDANVQDKIWEERQSHSTWSPKGWSVQKQEKVWSITCSDQW